MGIRCFDCTKDDWIRKFHQINNRSFCDECYLKRIQPDSSKREDSCKHEYGSSENQDNHKHEFYICNKCDHEMRYSEHGSNIVREVQ